MRKVSMSMTLAALLLSSAAAYSQKSGFYSQPYKSRNSGSFDKGTNLFSIGIGAPYGWGNYNVAFPPVYLKYEHGIMDEVGIGVIGGIGLGKWNSYRYTAATVGVLGYYHFNKLIPVSKLDVYLGAGGSVVIDSYNDNFSKDRTRFRPLAKVGARYYFTPSIGVYLEGGADAFGPVNGGITFRF